MSRIHLTIDHLALKGFDPADARAVADALRSELARILSDPSAREHWVRSHRTPVLRLGSIPIENGSAGGRKFGNAMARAIGKGLKP